MVLPRYRPQHIQTRAASRGPARLRRVLGVTAGAVLAAAALVVIGVLGSGSHSPSAPGLAAAAEPATDSSVAQIAAESTGTGSGAQGVSIENAEAPATSARPMALPGPPPPAQLPETGPGVTEPGILLVAWPAADGSFDVIERVRLSGPSGELRLRPAEISRAGQQFARSSAAASQVQLSAGGQPVAVPDAAVRAALIVPVAQVDRFDLRYRLLAVTVRSVPSTAGRAIAAIGPLTAAADDLPVHLLVLGTSVLGLNCPLLPIGEQSCGSPITGSAGVERTLAGRLALTAVQFNLPLP